MVSAVDFMPTLCDVAGIEHPEGFDGRSFAPIIKGEKQGGREMVFKVYNENAGGNRHPIRAIQTKDYLFLFNPWSDGENVFRTATQGTATWRRMKELAASDKVIADRVEVMEHRVVEELFMVSRDPDCLQNLIDNPEHAEQANALRKQLEESMKATSDHALVPFRNRDDPAKLAAYMEKVQGASDERRANRRKARNKGKANPKKTAKLIKLETPKAVQNGQPLTVRISHNLGADLGEQKLQVTLKNAKGGRIERKIVSITGESVAEVSFDVPADLAGQSVSLAAFVGEEYGKNLQHLRTGEIPVK
jgi:N-sulfoglucosamine sulfohydrolase